MVVILIDLPAPMNAVIVLFMTRYCMITGTQLGRYCGQVPRLTYRLLAIRAHAESLYLMKSYVPGWLSSFCLFFLGIEEG